MKNRVKPTTKQMKTLEIKQANPKMPLGEAMRKAGYSPITALNPGANFVDTPGVAVAVEEYKKELVGLGITPKRIADKMRQLLDARKPFSSHTEPDRLIDDFQTQIKAVEMLREDLDLVRVTKEQNIDKAIIFQIIKDDKAN